MVGGSRSHKADRRAESTATVDTTARGRWRNGHGAADRRVKAGDGRCPSPSLDLRVVATGALGASEKVPVLLWTIGTPAFPSTKLKLDRPSIALYHRDGPVPEGTVRVSYEIRHGNVGRDREAMAVQCQSKPHRMSSQRHLGLERRDSGIGLRNVLILGRNSQRSAQGD